MKHIGIILLSAWIGLLGAPAARAQSITTIYTFVYTNGLSTPMAGLTLGPDGNFYGTAAYDGTFRCGGVFRVTTNGALTTLVNFNNTNGANPKSSLTLGTDGCLYGTTMVGGSASNGVVFKVTTGGQMTTLTNFNGPNGAQPCGLTQAPDGSFYGVTQNGGDGYGNAFKVTTNGVLTSLVKFRIVYGHTPECNLLLAPDGNFYGVTYTGGNSDSQGTVFQLTTAGTLTILTNFAFTNGANPWGGLTAGPDGNLYGTARNGGAGDYGSVFRVTTNGALTCIASFQGTNGDWPDASLTLGPDGNFYGTTEEGGSSAIGAVFRVTTNGVLTLLASFSSTNGSSPLANLTLGPDGNFYGTTESGGSGGAADGTIFRLNLPPTFIATPANQSTVIGSRASFQCQLFGTGPMSYQWLSNGIPVAGATNSSFSTASVSLQTTNVQYQVVAANAWGSITSGVASASVQFMPNIYAVTAGGSGTITLGLGSYPGTTNRLWATANPALPMSQWQLLATNVTDASGLAQFTDTNSLAVPVKFYRLSYP